MVNFPTKKCDGDTIVDSEYIDDETVETGEYQIFINNHTCYEDRTLLFKDLDVILENIFVAPNDAKVNRHTVLKVVHHHSPEGNLYALCSIFVDGWCSEFIPRYKMLNFLKEKYTQLSTNEIQTIKNNSF